jgi:hypothetical protein
MPERAKLKHQLATLGAVAEVGFNPDEAVAARIRALATELEALNPTAEPARAAALLRGRWRLLYSNFDLQRSTTLANLSFNMLPRTKVEVTELYNEIDPANGVYDNVITLQYEDGSPGTQVMLGDYSVDDDTRLDVRFSDALVTGQGAPVKLAVDTSRIPSLQTEITYLDDGFRLVRGPQGSLYILERLDAAPMLWSRDS